MLSAILVGEAGAALRTAAGQDLTAIGSSHSLAEPVLLGTLTLFGLIGTNHCCTPPVRSSGAARRGTRPPQRPFTAAVDNHYAFTAKTDIGANGIIQDEQKPCQP
ncbi:hypothetical protein KL86CLO1_13417 [uncultured Eubacteriales bacterium]|uniref:Uncharacterized protein n=1 Tax=uncultured Eubacteriales bacterium TaxID=172733 RepID=A0A212KJF4_9FIRM|nr:hypothetical protein KL86CLO1_13417 [uncultured Eubacteriales bacterium]